MNIFRFFINFLKDPHVAAILPSSRFVLKKVLDKIQPEKIKIAIEYGPGNGVLTKALLAKLSPRSRLIAIERNRDFYEELKKIQDPRLHVIHGDAIDVDRYLKDLKIEKADLVLSSIPFTYLRNNQREELLRKTKDFLPDEGKFIVYTQYTTRARPLLKKFFNEVKLQIEFRNIPPAFIFEAQKNQRRVPRITNKPVVV